MEDRTVGFRRWGGQANLDRHRIYILAQKLTSALELVELVYISVTCTGRS